MTNLMKKGYDKKIDPLCTCITNDHYYKYFPCILPLDHDNLQNFKLFVFHEKTAPIANPLASF